MNNSFIRFLFGLTLLLIGTTRNIECRPTVDMESNENNGRENDQISILLDLKKTVDRIEMRLEIAENRVLQETLQCSINRTNTGKRMRHHVGLHSSNYFVTNVMIHCNTLLQMTRLVFSFWTLSPD